MLADKTAVKSGQKMAAGWAAKKVEMRAELRAV